MPTSCSAYNCTNRFKKGCKISFHRFPINSELRKQWVENIRRKDFTPNKTSSICSEHFEDSCFDRTGQTIRLKEGAVPTKFNFPEHLKLPEPERIFFELKKPNLTAIKEEPIHETNEEEPILNVDSLQPKLFPLLGSQFSEHSYCLMESPKTLKRKIDLLTDVITKKQHKLKVTNTSVGRLRRKIIRLENTICFLTIQNDKLRNDLEKL